MESARALSKLLRTESGPLSTSSVHSLLQFPNLAPFPTQSAALRVISAIQSAVVSHSWQSLLRDELQLGGKGKVFTMTEGRSSPLRLGVAALLSALGSVPVAADSGLALVHVDGLSYSADGKRLLVPGHVRLALYSEGCWSKAPGPEHDLMG